MLNLIYDNNIYKDDIEILIVTAIKNNDIDKFIENLKNFKEKYINKEDNLEIKEKFVNFYNSICNSIYNDNSENVINENMQSVIKNCLINPTRRKNNISIKIVNEREREKKTVLRFYNKAIKVKGNSINTVVEVGNSLNFF